MCHVNILMSAHIEQTFLRYFSRSKPIITLSTIEIIFDNNSKSEYIRDSLYQYYPESESETSELTIPPQVRPSHACHVRGQPGPVCWHRGAHGVVAAVGPSSPAGRSGRRVSPVRGSHFAATVIFHLSTFLHPT